MAQYIPEDVEQEVFALWSKQGAYAKAKKRNHGKDKFYFLDGPPYTSGAIHIGTAWNKVLKDMVIRYKRMKGFDVWDRAGYDMHGLPIEHKVQDMLNLKFKDDIVKFGVDKFVMECEKLALANLKIMNKEFEQLGIWMDFDHAYQSISPEFIEGVWWLVKQADKKKRLYQDYRPVPWDLQHQSALAKHELEYKNVRDSAVYVKFKVKGADNMYVVMFTTTPWTIAFNLGVMVHPEVDYAKVEVDVKGKKELWIVAKELVSRLFAHTMEHAHVVRETMKGQALEGMEYEHPFYGELKKHYDALKGACRNVHTVVLSREYVTLDVGSGLVHMAPGCGPEDYEVGHKYDIPAWNLLGEEGLYPDGMGKFSRKHALVDNEFFIDALEKEHALVHKELFEHEYPHGQRSHKPVVFRATKQWFFKIEDLKPEMIECNNKVLWNPESGYNAFNSWLENLRDNSISKQRFWGSPVPIWQASDGSYVVVESRAELERLSCQSIDKLHKPWIDQGVIKKDGKTYTRIPDVLDVWIDAGSVSWNCLDFPSNTTLIGAYFPADLILEGRDQIRGWFNLLLVASMIGMHKPSFKAVYMHGMISDIEGVKMSKSLGNIISPNEVVEKHGRDAFRYYVSCANAGEDFNFSWDEIQQKKRNLVVLFNTANYVLDYGAYGSKIGGLNVEDRYILSKLHSTVQKATQAMNEYQLDKVPAYVEDLFLELSRVYIQLTRDRTKDANVRQIMVDVFLACLKMLAITCPFITEFLYQRFKKKFGLKEESVHLCEWPRISEECIDDVLEENFALAKKAMQEILARRNKEKVGIRWPLPKVKIVSGHADAFEAFRDIIKYQTNVKDVDVVKGSEGEFAVSVDTKLTPELEQEGYCREVMRKVQALRKKAGLLRADKIQLIIDSAYDLSGFAGEIKKKVGASSVSFGKLQKAYKDMAKEKIKDYTFEIGFIKA